MSRPCLFVLLMLSAVCCEVFAATIHVPQDHASVQMAIDAAKPGDIVLVAAGTYREPLKLKPGVIVKSAGNDEKGKVGLKRAEATILEGGVEMAAKAVLDGFTVTGVGNYDEKLWQHHFDTQGNEQPHEHIGADGTPGIAVAVECSVLNNIVHHIGYTGIAITGGSPRLAGNICYRNMGGGIGSMKGSTAIIEKNECFENFYAGIGCDASSPAIRDNFCHDNIRAGIGISEGSSPLVSGNRCHHNRRAGIGIRTGGATRPIVEHNLCRDNAMAGIGIEDGARPLLLENRLIDNKLVAIGVTGGSSAMIRDNELVREGGAPPMIAVLDQSKASILGNTIRGGGVAAILVKGTAEIRDNRFIGGSPRATNAIWAPSGAVVRLANNHVELWKHELNAAKDAQVTSDPPTTESERGRDLRADMEIFAKGIIWALRYDLALLPADQALIEKARGRFSERGAASAASWTSKKGKVARGFISSVDGSVQPYGVIIPKSYDGTKPMRLDVVLHGSSKPVGMSELKFINRFDEGDEDKGNAPDVDYIELHPLGRVENCYRWAGETDVFEAIEAVCRNYKIDRDRIVLRGMSMGASGTWHLGLKHPDRFVAIGPYCGYVDTHRFSETPIPGFIKVGPLPPHQELGLHLLDSIDYAANASMVPEIAAIGDQDTFFGSHVHMSEVFLKEGIPFVNLIAPGTKHVIDPKTHAEQMRRIGDYAAKGIDHDPKQMRFVTWTLKYNRCHWLELLALGKHYERAEFRATVGDGDVLEVSEARNVTRFAIHRPVSKVRIAGQDIVLPAHPHEKALVFSQTGGAWKCDGLRDEITLTGKQPGLQGPIDDAFATPFLCVRGTGKPWNAKVDAWAQENLERFEYEWARYMRGDLPVKNDTDVTEADMRDKHLILFGDPGSNTWIAKALPKLPVAWTREEVRLGEQTQSAANHAPAFICASPLAPSRYIVINSGHTFHEKEFAAFNYLLFPRLGDWAVMKLEDDQPVAAGYFDEEWRKAEPVRP
ncbi:right-handed parallel beta-helix repeat-containing protein [Prosthecobacter sp.]|uniref:right-handed parallel beta-helix repeat-containing protein n=1 Tax=Prosthecobacter sp. TaxID=1965333 RepID=UPI003783C658